MTITEKISSITLSGNKESKQQARENLAQFYSINDRIKNPENLFSLLSTTTMSSLDRKIKHGQNLSFDEAFCGMCYVLAATNNQCYNLFHRYFERAYGTSFSKEKSLAIASAFLNMMATKESLAHLTSEEISGMVACAMMDTMMVLKTPRIIETCGMGGDKGFVVNGVTKKSINVSTLSALVLSTLGLPAIKHGSYGNTSAVGSTEAIELFGALTSMKTLDEATTIIKKSNFCFFDAHWCKTIHDLSHLLMMETINHVIGPMTPPIHGDTEINKLMGVNEKIHPETVTRAYIELHNRGYQNIGGIIVVTGLDESGATIDHTDAKVLQRHVITDEVSPYASIISMAYKSYFLGTHVITPHDFGVSINPLEILIENNQSDIHQANILALCGIHDELAKYLAMNSALALFAIEYLPNKQSVSKTTGIHRPYLREAYTRCYEVIKSGKVKKTLQTYIQASGGTFLLGF